MTNIQYEDMCFVFSSVHYSSIPQTPPVPETKNKTKHWALRILPPVVTTGPTTLAAHHHL